MAFDPYSYAESKAPSDSTAAPPQPFDPYAYAASSQPTTDKPQTYTNADLAKNIGSGYEYTKGTAAGVANAVTSLPRSLLGNVAGLLDIPLHAAGITKTDPATVKQQWSDFFAFDPQDARAKAAQGVVNNIGSYLTPGKYKEIAENIAAKAPAGPDTSFGAGFQSRFGIPVPGVTKDNPEGIVNVNPEEQQETSDILNYATLPALASGKAKETVGKNPPSSNPPGAPPVSESPVSEEPINLEPEIKQKPLEPIEHPEDEMTPQEQGAAAREKQAILQRVGIKTARQSALNGDKADAATDYQLTKFNQEPAGRAAQSQFEHESDSMNNAANSIIDSTGGTRGLDQTTLGDRGVTIAQPIDSVSQYFKQRTQELYQLGQERSDELAANGNPLAYTQLPTLDALLQNKKFRNTLMGSNQQGLLSAVESQMQDFRENNPHGFTPATAETVRQWLNQLWSPDRSRAIGQLKDAIDNDVMSHYGDDIFDQARKMDILKRQTIDNPDWGSLFETDPKTPINRNVPYEKLPDRVLQLPVAQLSGLADTLKNLPDGLKPQGEAALNEIKGHLANKLAESGNETRSGNPRALWNGDAVSTYIKRNSAKISTLFKDDPETLQKIQDLNDAGKILKVDTSYPGAAAQAAKAVKRGVGSTLVQKASRAGGAAIGSMLGFGGAAVGDMAGNAFGERAASALSEKAALDDWRSRIKVIDKTPP